MPDHESAAQHKNYSTRQLKLLITIVPREKAEYYQELIEDHGSNFQFISMGEGSADRKLLRYFGVPSAPRAVIFSVIQEDQEEYLVSMLDERFQSRKHSSGVAVTVPLSSVIGSSLFTYLSNNRRVLS